jgi:hypothetical protein
LFLKTAKIHFVKAPGVLWSAKISNELMMRLCLYFN